jgi:hypothetical protein
MPCIEEQHRGSTGVTCGRGRNPGATLADYNVELTRRDVNATLDGHPAGCPSVRGCAELRWRTETPWRANDRVTDGLLHLILCGRR